MNYIIINISDKTFPKLVAGEDGNPLVFTNEDEVDNYAKNLNTEDVIILEYGDKEEVLDEKKLEDTANVIEAMVETLLDDIEDPITTNIEQVAKEVMAAPEFDSVLRKEFAFQMARKIVSSMKDEVDSRMHNDINEDRFRQLLVYHTSDIIEGLREKAEYYKAQNERMKTSTTQQCIEVAGEDSPYKSEN